jgi:hypothetical protein
LNTEDHIDILDTPKPTHSLKKQIIIWWEKRRLIYNVLIIAFSVFLMYTFWDYPMRTIIGTKQVILDAVIFIFIANVCYTSGWILGIINHYLFNTKRSSNTIKWILFTIGTICSLLWTNFYFVIMFDVLFAH